MSQTIQDFLERVGDSIRQLREQKGLSQEKLAQMAGIDRTYISPIELGKQNPSLEVVFNIAQALDVPVSLIIRRAEYETEYR